MAQRALSAITRIIVHCADTPDDTDFTALDINQWHKQRGFRRDPKLVTNAYPLEHIGYHFVIERDGKVVPGRGLGEIGAHAKGHNTASIGICLVGRKEFTPQQYYQLAGTITQLNGLLHAQLEVISHRDVNPKKTCPNFDAGAWWRDWQTEQCSPKPVRSYPSTQPQGGAV